VTFALYYDAFDSRTAWAGGASPVGCAVVRIEPPRALLTGLIVGNRTYPHWVDKDGDGTTELEFARWMPARGGPWRIQRQSVGVFKLDGNNDGPALQEPPTSDEFLVWMPPDGQPLAIPDDRPADEFFRSLLEVPANFGAPTSSAPTALTSTRS
jgi:hypothetical protein